MNKGTCALLCWAVLGCGVALGQTPVEPLQPPKEVPDASTSFKPLTPLPPIPGPAVVGTPEPSAPPLPPIKRMGGLSFKKEYLVWWVRDTGLPGPLVTTGTAASAGVLGVPGTEIVYGGSGLDLDHYNGLRDTCTFWLDPDEKLGVQVSGFLLSQQSEVFLAGSFPNGSPLLARPLIDPVTGQETVSLAAFPGSQTGGIGTSLTNRLWGVEANVLGYLPSKNKTDRTAGEDMGDGMGQNMMGLAIPGFGEGFGMGTGQMLRCGLLAGFRYLRFDERLDVFQRTTLLQDGVAGFFGSPAGAGDTLFMQDSFNTRTQFWGPQIGALTELKFGPAVLTGTFKVAAGTSHQVVNANGSTSLFRPGAALQVGPGGVLAVASNSGRYAADVFAVVPEVGVSIGLQPIRNCRATLGYNFLYCSSVVRAGDQVNRIVNPSQIPSSLGFGQGVGPLQPQLPFDQTDFWAQGLNFSLELRF